LFFPFHSRTNLPSFPTRRSSDLDHPQWLEPSFPPVAPKQSGSERSKWNGDSRNGRVRHPPASAPTPPDGGGTGGGTRTPTSLRRSEEHTSELQSRENLVCRLLLE